ncbi:putative reverse transcriptase domain-containing protein [Tanacetum coccineum]
MSEARMREIIRDQVTTSMNEFMANMNRGTGGAGAGGAGARGGWRPDCAGAVRAGAGGDGAGVDGAGGAGAGGDGHSRSEVTGCIYYDLKKEKDKVKFASATLQGRVLTWWNGRTASMGIDAANGTPWAKVRKWMTEEFCPQSVLQRLEQELYNLKLKGTDIDGYTNRFHELALLCPRMVEPEQVKVEQYIRGLSKNIRGDVTSSQPATIDHAVRAPTRGEGTCFNCNKKGHLNKDCPTWRRNGQDGNNRGAVYKLGVVDAQQDPKVVTGTFLLNNRYATALFDSGADKSFVSTNFSTSFAKPARIKG